MAKPFPFPVPHNHDLCRCQCFFLAVAVQEELAGENYSWALRIAKAEMMISTFPFLMGLHMVHIDINGNHVASLWENLAFTLKKNNNNRTVLNHYKNTHSSISKLVLFLRATVASQGWKTIFSIGKTFPISIYIHCVH